MIVRRCPKTYVEWRAVYQDAIYTLGYCSQNYFNYRFVLRMPDLLDEIHDGSAMRTIWKTIQRIRRIEDRMDSVRDCPTFYNELLNSIFKG